MHMTMTMKRLAAVLAAFALLAVGCGDDDDTTSETVSDVTGGDGEEAGPTVTVTVTEDSIEVPPEITGGVVEITVENRTDEDEMEVIFASVTPGTSEDAFRTALLAAFQGESIDEIIEAAGGVPVPPGEGSATETVILEAGEYFFVAEVTAGDNSGNEGEGDAGAEGGEGGEGGPPTLLVAAATVTEGPSGELPETDGTITAVDYSFEVDVQAGEAFTFVNEGPIQFHHAVLFNFGSLDPAVVEDNIAAFLETEEPPEALADGLPEEVYAGGSAVFSPGLGGTFRATLESGTTYAAVCFIGDRAGGPPHAFAYDMYEVFTVD
jgi:ribosomal protein L12E/L44/L45/RPP1/RPP2